MASSIDASTSGAGGIITTADNTGILQLKSGGTTIATISSTGLSTQVGSPAFSAYLNTGAQTLSNATWTKLTFNAEEFDTNNNFDATTNYRFTPTVAGYYQIDVSMYFDYSVSQFTNAEGAIYKNGSAFKKVVQQGYGGYGTGVISTLIYMNGSTDYLEVYAYISGGSGPQIYSNSLPLGTFFQGFLARSA